MQLGARAPRAEWNLGTGYIIRNADKVILSNVITDRNYKHGMDISHQNGQPLIVNGAYLTRDGRDGATDVDANRFAAIRLHAGGSWGCGPVVLNGIGVKVGTDDGGAGFQSPNYGIWGTTTYDLQIGPSSLRGREDGYRHDGGGNRTHVAQGVYVESGLSGSTTTRRLTNPLVSYTTATRPAASASTGHIIQVSDGAAGSKVQFSDGSAWIGIG